MTEEEMFKIINTKKEMFLMIIKNEGCCDQSFSCADCKELFDGICPLIKLKADWAKSELAKLPPENSKTEQAEEYYQKRCLLNFTVIKYHDLVQEVIAEKDKEKQTIINKLKKGLEYADAGMSHYDNADYKIYSMRIAVVLKSIIGAEKNAEKESV